jgi:hypothetical protein
MRHLATDRFYAIAWLVAVVVGSLAILASR